jgi:thiamine-phosphate pyrophosphorylase
MDPQPPKSPQKISPAERTALLRVLDAAANRATEGLRVVEDYVRFVWDDRYLTELCKQSRHDLAAVLARLGPAQRYAARDTQADVGTALTAPSEQSRDDAASVLAANFQRVEQSLRSLEEYAKILDPQIAADFEQLRYRAYTLERAVLITGQSAQRLGKISLCVLVDGRENTAELARWTGRILDTAPLMIQLRDKRLGDRELLERARLLRGLTRDRGSLLIVNDRPDMALLAQADGVHLGQEDVSVKDARAIVGPAALIGVSTHSLEQARQAVLDGANYIGVGPTFPSETKSFADYPGLELLRAVAAEVSLPAFAIGGITAANAPQVLTTGMTRVAVSSALAVVADPAAVSRALVALLNPHNHSQET